MENRRATGYTHKCPLAPELDNKRSWQSECNSSGCQEGNRRDYSILEK
jgi:hypothetical protein